ncbi:hypothetical protein BOTBODRAFT_179306 [Botryobasidium botryosum FD-172 SS1]|uniref:Uncharacterized protein n=1 Tax=Botryobasidium botryosum (strain FD-172 SS1) TaxID=930990 RepID=A0A067M339_BOTB1|nr:hypothetical protein BOTBODRAFT_179306 [Botryobasidium botryosum FD-172 SS1]
MRTSTSISAIISALLVVSLAPGPASAGTTCNIKTFGGTPGNGALIDCLHSYRTDNWDGKNCGGLGWFKGGSLYNSPVNCYDACFNCIQNSINAGATSVQCDDAEGLADCWMGYH